MTNDEHGFSLLETLVGIVILGFVVTISILLYISLFSNPKNLLRNEALILASQEVEYIKANRTLTDTNYYNEKSNLQIVRKIISEENYNIATVTINSKVKNTKILKLSFIFKNPN